MQKKKKTGQRKYLKNHSILRYISKTFKGDIFTCDKTIKNKRVKD